MTQQMERILVISTMYPGKRNPSFGIFVENQVQALRKRGFHVDVIAIQDHRMDTFHVIKKYSIWILRILVALFTKGKNYTIVHAHYIFPSGKFTLLFKKCHGAKVIVTAHGGDMHKMAQKGTYFHEQTKKVLQHADHIIAVGETLKQDMTDYFEVNKDNISILNMGVNRDVFSVMDKNEAKQCIGVSSKSKHCLFVGNLLREKGLEELVIAHQGLKKTYPMLELHLIGAAKDPVFLEHLKRTLHKESIQDVFIHQAMAQADIATWMAAADVFVIPSHSEGFGLVALEAMSCHTPVVGTNVGGLHYLLGGNAGIQVEAKNPVALQKAIEHVLTNKQKREELLKNGEKKARKYNQEKLLDELVRLYIE